MQRSECAHAGFWQRAPDFLSHQTFPRGQKAFGIAVASNAPMRRGDGAGDPNLSREGIFMKRAMRLGSVLYLSLLVGGFLLAVNPIPAAAASPQASGGGGTGGGGAGGAAGGSGGGSGNSGHSGSGGSGGGGTSGGGSGGGGSAGGSGGGGNGGSGGNTGGTNGGTNGGGNSGGSNGSSKPPRA